jgi:hypothetical protein
MLEQKLIVNRYINLALQNVAAPNYADGDFVRVQVQDCYLAESTGVFTKTSAVRAGSGPKAHRNFKWLPWLPGAISEVALVGADVLTGPMSGCWLVSYRKPNGVPHAGHLGTDIASVVRTNAVNNAWNNFATANPGDVIGGFNPLRHWNGNWPARQNGELMGAPKIFGLFTRAGQFYVLAAYQQAVGGTLMRIAGLQLVQSATLARLQQVHTPGP